MKIIARRKAGVTAAELRNLLAQRRREGARGEILYARDGLWGILILQPHSAEEAVFGWENQGDVRIQYYRVEGWDMRRTLADAGTVPGYAYMVEGIAPCDDAARYRPLAGEEAADVAEWRAKLSPSSAAIPTP